MYQYKGKVVRVVDGDTYDILVDLGFAIYHKIRVRLKGVDTPEVFGARACAEGRAASVYVKGLLENQDVIITTYRTTATTFNRWEADVMLCEADLDVGKHLVESGYGTVWTKD